MNERMGVFKPPELMNELRTLPPKHRLAFAASCCERLFPNYRAFAFMENWGEPRLLGESLDEVWNFLAGADLDEARIHELIRAIELVVPDTEDFSSAFTSAGLDAANAVLETLEGCVDGDALHAADVAGCSIDTIDMYLNIVNDPHPRVRERLPNEWIDRHPLMIAELQKQRQDISDLKGRPVLDADFLDRLRQSSSELGIQPFLRGLVKEPQADSRCTP